MVSLVGEKAIGTRVFEVLSIDADVEDYGGFRGRQPHPRLGPAAALKRLKKRRRMVVVERMRSSYFSPISKRAPRFRCRVRKLTIA